jgi:hypothetical protein
MTFWKFLNSPIVLTIVSFLLGGVLASAISALWQRRSQKHSVQLSLSQEIISTYQEYVRFLSRKSTIKEAEEFDRLHADLLSKARISRVLYGDEIADELISLAKRLANVQHLRLKGDFEHAENQREKAYKCADNVIEKIFKILG